MFRKKSVITCNMVLTYGTALMSCTEWAEIKMQLERGSSDSLGETDAAPLRRQGSQDGTGGLRTCQISAEDTRGFRAGEGWPLRSSAPAVSQARALSPQCPDFFHTVGTLAAGLLCLWRWKPLGASLVAEMVKKPLGKYLTLLSLEHQVQTRKACRRVSSSAQRKLHRA